MTIALKNRLPEARSSVTNHRALFLEPIDGRSSYARRFHDVFAAHVGDLGGTDQATEAQLSIARRAAALTVECERIECSLARLDKPDPDLAALYATLTNTLRRLLTDLGLERRQRDVTDLSKVLAAMPPPSKRAVEGQSQ